jgi:hypothetical protein
MERVTWSSVPHFYRDAWDTMPFNTRSEAQQFTDFIVSRTRYLLSRLEIPGINNTLDILQAQIAG